MEELKLKTKELELLTLTLTDIYYKYDMILSKIKEIEELSKKNEFQQWNEQYGKIIIWLKKIGEDIANFKKEEILVNKEFKLKLENLVHFLVKYNKISQKLIDIDAAKNEKIKKQINDLYQNLFHNQTLLIKEEAIDIDFEKIIPYFKEKEIITFNNDDDLNFKIKVDLNTKFYLDSNLKGIYTTCLYSPQLKRDIIGYSLVKDRKITEVSDINKVKELLKASWKVLGVKISCQNIFEGWCLLKDVSR